MYKLPSDKNKLIKSKKNVSDFGMIHPDLQGQNSQLDSCRHSSTLFASF